MFVTTKGKPRRRIRFTPQSRPFTRLAHGFNAYVLSWTFGLLVIPAAILLMIFGKIRTRGYWKAWRELKKGKVILTSNHPSLVEPVILVLVFVPHFLYLPLRFWPWSMPDRNTFLPKFLWPLYWVGRCITVDRRVRSHNNSTIRRSQFVLSRNGNLAVHPEGTRTPKSREIVGRGERKIGKLRNASIFELAANTGGRILPEYVDFHCSPPDNTKKGTLKIILEFFTKGMTIHYGNTYTVAETFDLEEENRKLEQAILGAGLD